MSRAEKVKEILERTVKDITALKELSNDPKMKESIDAGVERWLLTLHIMEAYYRSDDL